MWLRPKTRQHSKSSFRGRSIKSMTLVRQLTSRPVGAGKLPNHEARAVRTDGHQNARKPLPALLDTQLPVITAFGNSSQGIADLSPLSRFSSSRLLAENVQPTSELDVSKLEGIFYLWRVGYARV